MQGFDRLESALPGYARDAKLNLGQIGRVKSLSPQQLWGTALAVAVNSGRGDVIAAVREEAGDALAPEARDAAGTAAAIMAMNNVYYRFTHLASNKVYTQMPARLRMQGLANPAVDKADFELWCLAVSAVNGCGACVDSHEKTLRDHGVGEAAIQDAVRVAAIVHAVAAVLDGAGVTSRALSEAA